ncbi:MAG: Holliday junction resolvase RuvX [Candidatus Sumerlaeia bacterium]|nr:Holliday junction resolvase RuvX [Candidatus Sumerlaeia bacterium]
MTHPPDPSTRRVPILALDVGDVRIGVAVSESLVIAQPIEALDRQKLGRKGTLDALEALLQRFNTHRLVVGLPLLEGGREGEQVEKTRAFVRSLQRRRPGVEVNFWDERYSSGDARGILGNRSVPKGYLDSVAAAVFLQEYLDHHTAIPPTLPSSPPAGESPS